MRGSYLNHLGWLECVNVSLLDTGSHRIRSMNLPVAWTIIKILVGWGSVRMQIGSFQGEVNDESR